jgi:hypothetical protein
MANTIQKTYLENGIRNAVIRLSGLFDGSSGGESAVKKVDVAADFTGVVTAQMGAPTSVAIEVIQASTQGGLTVTLLWEATVNVEFWNVGSSPQEIDFRKTALITNSAGAGNTGNILLTTSSSPAANSSYDIVLRLRKTYANAS